VSETGGQISEETPFVARSEVEARQQLYQFGSNVKIDPDVLDTWFSSGLAFFPRWVEQNAGSGVLLPYQHPRYWL